MECRDFESIIDDLARDGLMESLKRASALAHSRECPTCAARLEDARSLGSGLAALAASYSEQESPRRVEENLLVMFRQRAMVAPQAPRRVRWMRITAAAAAAIIIVAALVWSRQQSATPQQAMPKGGPPPAQNERDRKLDELAPVIADEKPAPEPKRKQKPRGSRIAGDSRARDNRLPPSETEIATDFLPLVEYDNLINFESGEIRRVMLSRSSLVSLGLPVNMDRANEPVKADVLVGHDGLARAIRFVR